MQGEEIEFGVEVDDSLFNEGSHKYFDGETVFKTLNFECCDDGDASDTREKVNCCSFP